VDEMKRFKLFENKEKADLISLPHSELVHIVWIDPKTGTKRIFRTKKIELGKPKEEQRDWEYQKNIKKLRKEVCKQL